MPVIPLEIIKEVEDRITDLPLDRLVKMDNNDSEAYVEELITYLHSNIDDKKRVSYGITYVVKVLCKIFYKNSANPYELGRAVYDNMSSFRTKCVGLGILSYVGIKRPDEILPQLADAAASEQWEIKEFVQMFVRKITKKHPEKVGLFFMEMAKSDDPNKRRFASESLRPVAENRWINDNPEFSLSVLRLLFKENHPFPRVSVGNNLSDLSRKNPELIFSVIAELMGLNDKNAEIIAHRACRNLVTKEPIRVMDLLKCDEYKYKNRVYKRGDC